MVPKPHAATMRCTRVALWYHSRPHANIIAMRPVRDLVNTNNVQPKAANSSHSQRRRCDDTYKQIAPSASAAQLTAWRLGCSMPENRYSSPRRNVPKCSSAATPCTM